MPAFRVIYNPGQYEQGALEPRKRLKDDDVAEFIRFWMQGRWALWMGTHFLSQRGVPLSSKMIRSHAKRMQEQGLIPAPSGVIQPHWTDWVRPAGDEPGRVPTVSATGVTWPDAHRYAVKLNRGGRPRKRLRSATRVASRVRLRRSSSSRSALYSSGSSLRSLSMY